MKNYKISYKNGNKPVIISAHSVEHHDSKYYICTTAHWCDSPSWYTLNDAAIESIEEV